MGSGGSTKSSSGIFDDICSEVVVIFLSIFFRGVATAFFLLFFDAFFVTSELLMVRSASMPLLPKAYVKKNRVENDRKSFWNPHSFIWLTRKFSRKQSRKIQNIYQCYIEFSRSGFPRCSQHKRAGISKKILSFFTLFLYIVHLHTLVLL